MGFTESIKSSKEESSTLMATSETTTRLENKTGGFEEPTDDTCCARFWADLTGTCCCRPNFRAKDGPTKTIDVPASFSPLAGTTWSSSIFILGCKFVTLGVIIYTIYLGFFMDPRPFYFAYLTHWGLLFSLAYSVLSVFNSLVPVAQPPPGTTQVSKRTIATWVLFTIAVHTEVLVSLLYWTLLFDGELFLVSVFSHGIVAVSVFVDGFFVNSIPIRLRHWFECVMPVDVLFILWTVLHSSLVFGIGNPDYQDEDVETNDDLIYSVLDWAEEPGSTGIMAVLIVLVLSPVIYLVLWGISVCRRRHVTDEKVNDDVYVGMTSTV